MSEQETQSTTKNKGESFISCYKKQFIGLGVVFIVLMIAIGGIIYNDHYYGSRAFAGVQIGSIDVSGMTDDDMRDVFEAWYDTWWENQVEFIAFDDKGTELTTIGFYPIIVKFDDGSSYEFISFDFEKNISEALEYGKSGSPLNRLFAQAKLLASSGYTMDAEVFIDEVELKRTLQEELENYESGHRNATFIWGDSSSTDPDIQEESDGNSFDYESAIATTKGNLAVLDASSISINRSHVDPSITVDDLTKLLPKVESLKAYFPMTISYNDSRIDFNRTWKLDWNDIYQAIQAEISDNNELQFYAMNHQSLIPFWEVIEEKVNIQSKDAKFQVDENGKVQQFQASEKGFEVDRDTTLKSINDRLIETEPSDDSVLLAYNEIEPQITTSSVNNLGINEVLGVGYSSFAGSPRNRIHNIQVGADKLNGLLVAPGEEFSLIEALRPFTVSEGYLPELVIKGDKIEPEVGGGLCQIGSTTFRAAMKSGLKITQRRNHSLVVSYYNDHRNGNPGTDATIYEGAVDFKFENDTPAHVLITTSMNAATGDLFFTFWGTSDGRIASYSEPVVGRWIPAGETKYIETENLEPGEEKCQGAHPGASASFTYSVTRADGELEETDYVSNYRSLPRICLVGIDPNADPDSEGGEVLGETMPADANESAKESTSASEKEDTGSDPQTLVDTMAVDPV